MTPEPIRAAGPASTGPVPPLWVRLPGRDDPVDVYSDEGFKLLSQLWVKAGFQRKLAYEATWLGVPIIQIAEDLVMMQELLCKVRPRVVVETGVAHGGTAIFYASILKLLGGGRVVAVEIELRKYNRLAILSHPMSDRITLIDGNSVDAAVVERVRDEIAGEEPVLVALDSNHAREHVRRELELYSPFVAPGGYIIAFDTVMDRVADTPIAQPDWAETGVGAGVRDFLREHPEFEPDPYYTRLGATYMEGGVLRRKQYAEARGGEGA